MFICGEFRTIGNMVKFLNINNIKKEDIMYINRGHKNLILIYWKEI